MGFSTKLRLINQKFEQRSVDELNLSGKTVIDGGDLRYVVHPTFTGDTQIVDKKYVDDKVFTDVSANTIYDLDSPSTVTVGGLTAGSVLTGNTSNELLRDILVPYLPPTFSSFGINGQNNTVEVGTTLSGNQLFTWGTTQPGNVANNSIDIIDVTNSNTPIGTNLDDDSSQSIPVGTINFTTNGQLHQWRAEGENTQAGSFQSSNFTINSIHPWFYGKVSSPGAAGAARPTASQAMINDGTKVLGASTGAVTVSNFASTSDDYIWIAVPATSNDRDEWYVSEVNKGIIGGSISPGGNLFPDAQLLTINDQNTTNMWTGVSYKFYISNKQTAATNMQFRT